MLNLQSILSDFLIDYFLLRTLHLYLHKWGHFHISFSGKSGTVSSSVDFIDGHPLAHGSLLSFLKKWK